MKICELDLPEEEVDFLTLQWKGHWKRLFDMQHNRGIWIGVAVSGFCISFISFVVFCALNPGVELGALLNGFCHQISDRCYHINGVALPICVRCLWIYMGLAVGHVFFLFWRPSDDRITRVLICVIGLMVLDVFLETVGFYENRFWTRALTGFLFGVVISHFTLLGLQEIYSEFSNPITYVRSRFFPGRTR